MKTQNFKITSLVFLFLLCISFPLLNSAFNIVKDTENLENRAMAKKPIFDVNFLDPFPAEYEKYYNDFFPLRSIIIKYYTNYKLALYKKSPFPERVIIGYNEWLYLAGNDMNCYLGTNRLTNEQLNAFTRDLEFQKKYVEDRGGKFYFMVVPTKANAHPENIPYTYFRFSKEPLGLQLTNHLKKNSSINVISLFESFPKLAKTYDLYYKQDNHWNQQGAFFAANIATSKISIDFPEVKPLNLADFSVKQSIKKENGDIANLLGSADFYEDREYELINNKNGKALDFDVRDFALPFVKTRENNTSKKPKLMLVSDSFSNLLFPFIAKSFGSTLQVFDAWQYHLQTELINTEKPDIYLVMVYEPFLMFVQDNEARLKKQP